MDWVGLGLGIPPPPKHPSTCGTDLVGLEDLHNNRALSFYSGPLQKDPYIHMHLYAARCLSVGCTSIPHGPDAAALGLGGFVV